MLTMLLLVSTMTPKMWVALAASIVTGIVGVLLTFGVLDPMQASAIDQIIGGVLDLLALGGGVAVNAARKM